MNTLQKCIIVFIGCGIGGVCTFMASVKPDMAGILIAANMSVGAIVGYLTGFQPKAA